MQKKSQCLEATASSVGLRISEEKRKITKVMTDCLETVSLTKLKGPIDEVEEFTHLGSVVSTRGATEQDVEARLGKTRAVFRVMEK